MIRLVIMNYVTSEIDIVDFTEKNISIENWVDLHYDVRDVCYMTANELSINFINSNKYGNSYIKS